MTITPYVPPTFSSSVPSGMWSGVNGLAVFPYLIGQTPEVSKTPSYATEVKRASSGRERRTALWPYPLWEFDLSYEVLRHKPTLPELFIMWEFFCAAKGKFGVWLFVDPSDNQILSSAPQTFGVGDGTTTVFTLSRPVNSVREPVYSVYQQTVQNNGVTLTAGTDYTLSTNGQISFTVAPAAAAALTWWGYFYFGCRFDQDGLTFKQFVNAMWKGDSLKFTSLRV